MGKNRIFLYGKTCQLKNHIFQSWQTIEVQPVSSDCIVDSYISSMDSIHLNNKKIFVCLINFQKEDKIRLLKQRLTERENKNTAQPFNESANGTTAGGMQFNRSSSTALAQK